MSSSTVNLQYPALAGLPKSAEQLKARDYKSDQEVRWCPGCGDYSILATIQAFLPTLLSVQVDKRPAVGLLAAVDEVRTWIRSAMEEHLSPTGSALARGFLIGETRDIPPDIYGMFRDSGTLHVLAVSGSNVALVLLFFIWVLRPFWLKPSTRAIILLVVIALFAGLSYGDPSVIRASTGLFVSMTPPWASINRPRATVSMPEPPLGMGRPPIWWAATILMKL